MHKGAIASLEVLCTFGIEENVQKPVRKLARFQCSHVAKVARRLVLVAINTTFLKAFMLIIRNNQITAISAYQSPLAQPVAFHFEC